MCHSLTQMKPKELHDSESRSRQSVGPGGPQSQLHGHDQATIRREWQVKRAQALHRTARQHSKPEFCLFNRTLFTGKKNYLP
jgi:hypothetical protein